MEGGVKMSNEIILKNKLGQNGETTKPTVMTHDFLTAFFNIEKGFKKREKFEFAGRFYDKNHITHADIQVITILFKICSPDKGVILNVKPHHIFKRLEDYYEQPIQISEFYASLHKLKLHGLISEEYIDDLGVYNYQINYYINPETKKIGFFALLHPIVFSKAFHQLSIGQKKLFYSFVVQQGAKERPLKRLLDHNHDDIRFSGLKTFLHRSDASQVKNILCDLTKPLKEHPALFKRAELIRETRRGQTIRRYHHAVLEVNKFYLIPFKAGQNEYHDLLKPTMVYPKQTNFMIRVLEQVGLGELISLNSGLEFSQMVRFLKNYGYRIIRHAIDRLKNFVDFHERFPANLISFLKKEVRAKKEALILDIARKTGVKPFIAYGLSGEERNVREFEFASFMSHFSMRDIKKAFKAALPRLKLLYEKPIDEVITKQHYHIHPLLSQSLKHIEVVRLAAYRKKVDLQAYDDLEHKIAKRIRQLECIDEKREKEIINDMLEKLEHLPVTNTIIDIYDDSFMLEKFLQRFRLIPNVSTPLF